MGEYRGFLIEVYFDPLIKEHTAILSGNGRYCVSLSGSADGNITRINNRLESIPESVTQCEHEIEDCQTQLEYAKAELEKPFAKEAELAEKSDRLAQLNAQLQFDQNENVLLSEKMENAERHPNAACL